jgi:hypothetical protein
MRYALPLLLALLALAPAARADERNDGSNRLPTPTKTVAKPDADGNGSFSAASAIAFIEQAGYVAVTDMERVNGFVWHGTALKDGQSYAISVDYTGAVVGSN